MLNKHEQYMKEALKEAKLAYEEGDIPIGAVVVENNKIIARAHNKKNITKRATDHAEILVINKANSVKENWRLDNCDIYITVEPCPMCASAIHQSRIRKVYYGTSSSRSNNEHIINEIFKCDEHNRKTEVSKGILEESCKEIMNEFFKLKRE